MLMQKILQILRGFLQQWGFLVFVVYLIGTVVTILNRNKLILSQTKLPLWSVSLIVLTILGVFALLLITQSQKHSKREKAFKELCELQTQRIDELTKDKETLLKSKDPTQETIVFKKPPEKLKTYQEALAEKIKKERGF